MRKEIREEFNKIKKHLVDINDSLINQDKIIWELQHPPKFKDGEPVIVTASMTKVVIISGHYNHTHGHHVWYNVVRSDMPTSIILPNLQYEEKELISIKEAAEFCKVASE